MLVAVETVESVAVCPVHPSDAVNVLYCTHEVYMTVRLHVYLASCSVADCAVFDTAHRTVNFSYFLLSHHDVIQNRGQHICTLVRTWLDSYCETEHNLVHTPMYGNPFFYFPVTRVAMHHC
jgi:hypothetical protein